MSKGSSRRPTNEEAFQSNWDAIFGKKKPSIRHLHQWDDCLECPDGTYIVISAGVLECHLCKHQIKEQS